MRPRIVTAIAVVGLVFASVQGAPAATAKKPVNGTTVTRQANPVHSKIIANQNQHNYWGGWRWQRHGWCYWHPKLCWWR